ncbi:gas vesicle protein GvpA/GvpJ/GvpM family [Krasilnikovia cinnamomea]|uniref:Gas vesicle protein A n=1 Tax=Krasilnikovia cinnamomea TaxID=349313 RepID=A0A4Q7ZS58_9ACTN|nr:gas vesicle protein GvpJ [Krasilnikovia cinnamomea]RZU54000.1 gas vesicle protein GvpA/GvpJ/GvpM family [Krasilnikovia cinnamomea]
MNLEAGLVERSASGGLSDVVGMILDKGVVVDAFARVSLVGIEVLTVEARVVVASIDTYLRYADAMARLDAGRVTPRGDLTGLVQGVAEGVTKGAIGAVQQSSAESVVGLLSTPDEPVRERPR